jgi:hypothetical protein
VAAGEDAAAGAGVPVRGGGGGGGFQGQHLPELLRGEVKAQSGVALQCGAGAPRLRGHGVA